MAIRNWRDAIEHWENKAGVKVRSAHHTGEGVVIELVGADDHPQLENLEHTLEKLGPGEYRCRNFRKTLFREPPAVWRGEGYPANYNFRGRPVGGKRTRRRG